MNALQRLEVLLFKNQLGDKTLAQMAEYLSETTLIHMYNDITAKLSTVDRGSNVVEQHEVAYVFTDGNCKNNGRQGAVGAFGVYFSDSRFSHWNTTRVITHPTNNRAELLAIATALATVVEHIADVSNVRRLIVCADSQYAIQACTTWCSQWRQNGWRNSKGHPVAHKDIIESALSSLDELKTRGVDVVFKHVPSHTKEPADKRSKAHFLWRGNNTVDTRINELLSSLNTST